MSTANDTLASCCKMRATASRDADDCWTFNALPTLQCQHACIACLETDSMSTTVRHAQPKQASAERKCNRNKLEQSNEVSIYRLADAGHKNDGYTLESGRCRMSP